MSALRTPRRFSHGRRPRWQGGRMSTAPLFRPVVAQRAVWPVVIVDALAGADQIHRLVPASRSGAHARVGLRNLQEVRHRRNGVLGTAVASRTIPSAPGRPDGEPDGVHAPTASAPPARAPDIELMGALPPRQPCGPHAVDRAAAWAGQIEADDPREGATGQGTSRNLRHWQSPVFRGSTAAVGTSQRGPP